MTVTLAGLTPATAAMLAASALVATFAALAPPDSEILNDPRTCGTVTGGGGGGGREGLSAGGGSANGGLQELLVYVPVHVTPLTLATTLALQPLKMTVADEPSWKDSVVEPLDSDVDAPMPV